MATEERSFLRGIGSGKDISLQVALISFIVIMVDGYDSLMISFIAPLLAHEWALRPTDIGKIFAVGYVGAIVGAIAMDRWRTAWDASRC